MSARTSLESAESREEQQGLAEKTRILASPKLERLHEPVLHCLLSDRYRRRRSDNDISAWYIWPRQ